MKISYSRDVDILTVQLNTITPIASAEQTENVIVHVDEQDQPVLLEILHAREFVSAIVNAVMQPETA